MAQEFFDSLVACIRKEGEKHPGQGIDPEVLRAFMSGWSASSAGGVPAAGGPLPGDSAPGAGSALCASGIFRSAAPDSASERGQRRAGPDRSGSGVARCRVARRAAPDRARLPPLPLAETRHNVVFGEGDPHAKLMFIGEGPGYDEDMQGRPFVGKAGQLLNKMIAAMQFQREEVYIANVVKCRPPGNRVPTPDEAVACIGYLKKQIELIRPEVIVLLGATAVNFLLGKREGITRLRGKWLGFNGIPVMPTFHPAYLLRQESAKRDAWADLQQVMKVFGKVYQRPH